MFLERKEAEKKKMLDKGIENIEKLLDTQRLIQYLRALKVMLRLKFSKSASTMIFAQRRHTVLETHSHSEEDIVQS